MLLTRRSTDTARLAASYEPCAADNCSGVSALKACTQSSLPLKKGAEVQTSTQQHALIDAHYLCSWYSAPEYTDEIRARPGRDSLRPRIQRLEQQESHAKEPQTEPCRCPVVADNKRFLIGHHLEGEKATSANTMASAVHEICLSLWYCYKYLALWPSAGPGFVPTQVPEG